MRSDMPNVVRELHRSPKGKSVKTGKRLSRNEIIHATDDDDDDINNGMDTREMERSRDWENGQVRYKPLRRYLRAQVGRPWSTVYSEICQTFTNLKDFHDVEWAFTGEIALHAYRGADGHMYSRERFGTNRLNQHDLYVEDDIIKVVTKPTEGFWSRRFGPHVQKVYPVTEIKQPDGTVLAHDEQSGCWFREVRVPYTAMVPVYGYVRNEEGRLVWTRTGEHPETRYTTTKKQLNRKELKHHGLTNGPLEHRPNR